MTVPDSLFSEYDTDSADAMLDALVEADGGQFAEARGRSRGRPGPGPSGVTEAQRNGQGIKAINDRINVLDHKVDQAVRAIAQDRAAVRKLEKLNKIDGALDLAASFNGTSIDVFQVLRGALKSGFFGEPKGALGNPAVIGVAGLVLRNPAIIGGIFGKSS